MNEFEARKDSPACRIGHSKFTSHVSSNNVSYDLTIDEPLRGARRLHATFSWRMNDGDFDSSDADDAASPNPHQNTHTHRTNQTHEWNMVAPRCRVRGTIHVENSNRQIIKQYQINGTGYHDHNRDTRPPFSTVKLWQWGRAHFDDETTAIFYCYYTHDGLAVTKLLLVRDGKLEVRQSGVNSRNTRRDIFGVEYPHDLEFVTNTNISLQVSQRRVIDRSFFYIRGLSDATLKTPDGRTYQARAVTEHLAPRALKFRWLDWLVNMRIGRNGRTAFLP
ncbi:MAG: hypothetical protein NVSMB56_16080 [Pyrinomonadaceae bacterium]